MNDSAIRQYIQINPKFYDLVRQMAVKTFSEAFCETISNSIDAYTKGNVPKPWKVECEIDRKARTFKILDLAIGMNADTMKKKILEVGSDNIEREARGVMGRGAKDISALGDVVFHSIVDERYSSCEIDRFANARMILSDLPVTSEIRTDLKIPSGNGTVVILTLTDYITLPTSETMLNLLQKDYILRDYLSNPDIQIFFEIMGDDPVPKKQLVYDFPQAKKILDIVYEVPGYDCDATFTIYKSDTIIPNSKTERTLEFGFLISDSWAIYESSALSPQFRWMPQIKYLYGRLKCDMIRSLILDYIKNGSSSKNPTIVIDPARKEGLNREHPFTTALLNVPLSWLELTLNQVQDQLDQGKTNSNDIENIMKSMQELGTNFINQNLFNWTWRSKRDEELLANMQQIKKIDIDQDVIKIPPETIDNLKGGKGGSSVNRIQNSNPANTAPSFKLILTNNPNDSNRYNILTYNNTLYLQLNTAHPSLAPYYEVSETEIKLINHGKGTLAIGPIIAEAFTKLMLRDHLLSNPDVFSGMSAATDIYNQLDDIRIAQEQKVAPSIYSTINSIIASHNKSSS